MIKVKIIVNHFDLNYFDFWLRLQLRYVFEDLKMPEPQALVAAASGIGDIIRITPLIRVLKELGYAVDFLLKPDYVEIATLFDGAPEIRRLYVKASSWSGQHVNTLQGLSAQSYELAIFTIWSLPLQPLVRAARKITFEPNQWRQEGDAACTRKMAQALGWTKPMPPPFVVPSPRTFNLAPRTVALHPGCKPNWPWKKWHGFDELAGLMPEVVLVGTKADLQNAGTYFQREFRWPTRAKNFIDRLSLQDTAALISQCSALVANDSGLMHLGVALGVPTFGIFGVTNPAREAMPLDNMIPIINESVCAPECRRLPWGSRNCRYHLQCLKSLTPLAVREKIYTRI